MSLWNGKNCCAGVEVAIRRNKKANCFDLSGVCQYAYPCMLACVWLRACVSYTSVHFSTFSRINGVELVMRCCCRYCYCLLLLIEFYTIDTGHIRKRAHTFRWGKDKKHWMNKKVRTHAHRQRGFLSPSHSLDIRMFVHRNVPVRWFAVIILNTHICVYDYKKEKKKNQSIFYHFMYVFLARTS